MEWTLDELVGRVARALAGADVRAPNGRVSEVPDARMIRWYMTTGLVDRPLAMRGRVGLFGRRHLLQLVAIKRRQSEGRSLAEIQVELAGATDVALAAVARLPAAPARPGASPDLASDAADRAAKSAAEATSEPSRRERFWAQRPVPAQPALALVPDIGSEAPEPGVLHGVALDGAMLLLPRVPSSHDLAAIRAAAQPLLELLADRGLLAARTATASPIQTTDEGARG